MVLGVDKLLQLVNEQGLVVGLSERELTNPEGCGFDLRIGEAYKLVSGGYLGIEERKTSKIKLVAKYKKGEKKVLDIKPGECYLTNTVETVKLPNNVTAILQPRSTLYKSGIIFRGGNVAPGYEGKMTYLLYNPSPNTFKIEMGARFVHILFFEVKGKVNMYRGQWQGGRVAATKLEKQV